MEFPTSVLQGLNYGVPKPPTKPVKDWNSSQFNVSEEPCPVGCNPDKTTLAISKTGRRDKGRFVKVFYRESKLKPEETLEDKQRKFWAEFDAIEARNKKRCSTVESLL